ncbi:Aste57867_7969 [Aphanomyces stellatus]|uniref:Aste57867_7969 protein n=1 Tax=Aphanomyces stellatus TaxID=120398 RepID=A0A485KJ31_9STRA|nr:hypothetical protein As57867_007939 [Aphanomyces stellatus]VFT84862.1 Aste57867_7969 [Aphanomyces stellatus]
MPRRPPKKTAKQDDAQNEGASKESEIDLTQEDEVETPAPRTKRGRRASAVKDTPPASADSAKSEVTADNEEDDASQATTPPPKRRGFSSQKQGKDSAESNAAKRIDLDDDDEPESNDSKEAKTRDDNEDAEIPDTQSSTPTKSYRRSARIHNPAPVYTSPTVSQVMKRSKADADDSPAQTKKPTGRPPRPTKRTLSVNPPSSKRTLAEQGTKKAEKKDDDDDDVESEFVLFEAVRKGSCSFPDLLREWRTRFEENADQASRELINFIMNACGSKAICVEEHDDLEDLDMMSFVETVVESLQASNELSYPLASKAKTLRKFKLNFAEFWKQFVEECWESELIHNTDIIEKCVDWLTSLSSSEVRAIRHTSTFAAYEIGNALIAHARQLRDQLIPINRQTASVTDSAKKMTPKSKSKNPKMARLLEMKDTYDEQLANTMTYVLSLFNGVIIHRYRDSMPELRIDSVQTLGLWIDTIPEDFLVDNYLKYLGWMLNDKSAKVRKAVVDALQQLYEKEDNAEKLALFTSRFLRRYLEMCDDVDDDVVLSIVELIAKIDRLNLLDAESDLSVVERLVFNADDDRIRRAAAEFVCLQYDAFGVSDQNMTEKQLVTQAVALVEFAEEYAGTTAVDNVDVLVAAFWDNEDCQVLQNWRLLTMLLGSDAHEPSLSSDQQTILIRLLTAIVKELVSNGGEVDPKPAQKRRKKDDSEPMTIFFCREIPPLMLRFQSDQEKLCLLLQLVSTLNWNATIMNQHKKHVEDLLARLKHAYTTHSDERFLQELSCCIHQVMESTNTALTRDVSMLVQELLRESIEQCQTLLQQEKKSKTKDTEFGLQAWLARLHFLSGFVNMKEDSTVDIHTLLFDFVSERSTLDLPNVRLQSSCTRFAAQILLKEFMWSCDPIFKAMKPQPPIVDDTLIAIVDDVVEKRNQLENMLLQLLSVHLSEPVTKQTPTNQVIEIPDVELTDDQITYVNGLHATAFVMLSDLRCLCFQRFDGTIDPFNRMAFHPHKNLLMLSQSFYERTMENDESTDEALQESVLVALAATSLCNPQNKRQAATVLQQMTSPSFVSVVKAFGRHMCSLSTVKYLEIQILTLQQTFEDDPDAAISLGKVLNQSLGTKLATTLRGSFLKFMAEGLRFAFESPANGAFLSALKPYLARVDKAGIKSLHGQFDKLRQAFDDDENDVHDAVIEWESYFNGIKESASAALTKSKEPASQSQPPKRARDLSDDEGDDDQAAKKASRGGAAPRRSRILSDDKDETPATPPSSIFERPASKGRKTTSKASTAKGKRRTSAASKAADDDDDDTEEEEDEEVIPPPKKRSSTTPRQGRQSAPSQANDAEDKSVVAQQPVRSGRRSATPKSQDDVHAEGDQEEDDQKDDDQEEEDNQEEDNQAGDEGGEDDEASPKRKSTDDTANDDDDDDEVVGFRTKRRRR